MAAFFSKSGVNGAGHAESMNDAKAFVMKDDKAFGMKDAKSFDHGMMGSSLLAHFEAHLELH